MKRSPVRHWRGAVLFETAISLSLILLLLFGSIQVMIVAYYQVTLDAATFAHNRAVALGVPNGTITSNVDSPFSSVIAMAPINVSGTAASPNLGVSGVMYGSPSIGHRNGGVAMLLPQQSMATESITSAFATVTSSAIESMVMDVCPHFCMADGGFGSGGAQGTAISYFGSIDDNSPYVGGFGFMETCGTNDIDGTSYINTLTTAKQWDTCSNIVWRGMSMGPQLTPQNYEFQLPGMQGPAPTGPAGSVPTFTPVAGTFFVSLCHRRFYALIANQLANWPDIPTAGADLNSFLLTLFHGYGPDGTTSPGELIYAVRPSPVLASGWDDTSMFDPPSGGAHPYEGNENEGWGCWQY